MVQIIDTRQSPIGLFPNQETAEVALKALEEAGISTENLSLIPRTLDPNPPIRDTEAKKSAQAGAIAGALSGCLGGLILGFMSVHTPNLPDVDAARHIIGLILAGSAIGAAGGSLISGLGGVTVPKGEAEAQYAGLEQNCLIVLDGDAPENLSQIAEILRQHGSSL